jgi:hypothetical protein
MDSAVALAAHLGCQMQWKGRGVALVPVAEICRACLPHPLPLSLGERGDLRH